MLVRFYDYEGKFLEQAVLDKPLEKGEPMVLADGRYVVVDIPPCQVDWKNNVLFQPILLKHQK